MFLQQGQQGLRALQQQPLLGLQQLALVLRVLRELQLLEPEQRQPVQVQVQQQPVQVQREQVQVQQQQVQEPQRAQQGQQLQRARSLRQQHRCRLF